MKATAFVGGKAMSKHFNQDLTTERSKNVMPKTKLEKIASIEEQIAQLESQKKQLRQKAQDRRAKSA